MIFGFFNAQVHESQSKARNVIEQTRGSFLGRVRMKLNPVAEGAQACVLTTNEIDTLVVSDLIQCAGLFGDSVLRTSPVAFQRLEHTLLVELEYCRRLGFVNSEQCGIRGCYSER